MLWQQTAFPRVMYLHRDNHSGRYKVVGESAYLWKHPPALLRGHAGEGRVEHSSEEAHFSEEALGDRCSICYILVGSWLVQRWQHWLPSDSVSESLTGALRAPHNLRDHFGITGSPPVAIPEASLFADPTSLLFPFMLTLKCNLTEAERKRNEKFAIQFALSRQFWLFCFCFVLFLLRAKYEGGLQNPSSDPWQGGHYFGD